MELIGFCQRLQAGFWDAEDKVGVYSTVPNTDLVLLRVLNPSSLESSFFHVYCILCVGICVLFFIGGLLAWLVYQIVGNRFASLMGKIERMNSGNMKTRFSYRGQNEFGDISKSLNWLLDQLEGIQCDLRERSMRYQVAFEQTETLIFELD